MKLLIGKVNNFGSYENQRIDFSNLDLTLVYGKTGSGKSTLADIPCWILYGQTSKQGNVDEVRSWKNSDCPTVGVIQVQLSNDTIVVTRIRGRTHENDLYWTDESGKTYRGKDITETQKLLEKRLGVDADTYIAGGYFNELSPTGSFFTSKAKERRSVFEQVASLAFAIRLSERSTAARKDNSKHKDTLQRTVESLTTNHNRLYVQLQRASTDSINWEKTHQDKVKAIKEKYEGFEVQKEAKIQELEAKKADFYLKRDNQIASLEEAISSKLPDLQEAEATLGTGNEPCPTCGNYEESEPPQDLLNLRSKIQRWELTIAERRGQLWPSHAQLEVAKSSENRYLEALLQEEAQTNPHEDRLYQLEQDLRDTEFELEERKNELTYFEQQTSGIEQLIDLISDLRAVLLQKSIKEIETSTNHYLDKYFDAELRVQFTAQGSDNLEVEIFKSGYDCVYRQLSKGQRQLLKLSFVVSVMKAAQNSVGVHFNQLFFDEALDGLDTDLKVKAFSLFQELQLEHKNILLIDHAPEFQNLFSKKLHVTLEGDSSFIEVENV